MSRERTLHTAVCQYIRMQYPHVHFKTDLSGAFMGYGNMRTKGDIAITSSHRGFPDIIIYELKIDGADTYCALAIELKAVTPYTKSGTLKSSDHLKEQAAWLSHLSSIGFKTAFVTGVEEAIHTIDVYLK